MEERRDSLVLEGGASIGFREDERPDTAVCVQVRVDPLGSSALEKGDTPHGDVLLEDGS